MRSAAGKAGARMFSLASNVSDKQLSLELSSKGGGLDRLGDRTRVPQTRCNDKHTTHVSQHVRYKMEKGK